MGILKPQPLNWDKAWHESGPATIETRNHSLHELMAHQTVGEYICWSTFSKSDVLCIEVGDTLYIDEL